MFESFVKSGIVPQFTYHRNSILKMSMLLASKEITTQLIKMCYQNCKLHFSEIQINKMPLHFKTVDFYTEQVRKIILLKYPGNCTHVSHPGFQ